MKILILADVHLKVNGAGKQTLEEFVQFLRGIDPKEFERVIILGDLFDFWFEYKQSIFSGYFEVLAALHALKLGGVRLELICGNHDLWAGRFLRDHLDMTIHQDSCVTTLGNQKVLMVHGDGINAKDRSYLFYKKFARFPLVVSAFRLIHPDWAMKIAQGVSHSSRTMVAPNDSEDSNEVRAIRDYAETVLQEVEYDVVICGHTHFPERREFENGLYLNTGDWMEKRTYLIWDDGAFQREYYLDGKRTSG